jgi:hypothetical protein
MGLDFFSYWAGQRKIYSAYWAAYGGSLALLKSPYVHVSALVAGTCWYFFDAPAATRFSDIAISVIPNLLGFTIGAMAIVLAFSGAPIFKKLAEDGNPRSFFIRMMSNLVHFIVAQVSALVCGILAKSTGIAWLEPLTIFLLLYAILATAATAIQLFQAAVIYNAEASVPDDPTG